MTRIVNPMFGAWTNETIGPVSPGLLAQRGQEVMEHFRDAGIRIPPGNRLERAVKRLEGANQPDRLEQLDDQGLAEVAEALKTVWDAFLVTETWKSRPRRRNPFTNDRLACFLAGADLPGSDSSPKPRSTQFELFVTAQLVLGGADVRPDEPDLTFLYHGEYVGVAAKRLTKKKRQTVADRIRGARHQLRDNKVKGFIALNLDSWTNDLHIVEDPESYGRRFNAVLQEAHQEFAKTPEEEFVLGALIFNHSVGWIRDAAGVLTLRWSEGSQWLRFTEDPEEEERAEEFFGPLVERMRNGLHEAAEYVKPRPGVGRQGGAIS